MIKKALLGLAIVFALGVLFYFLHVPKIVAICHDGRAFIDDEVKDVLSTWNAKGFWELVSDDFRQGRSLTGVEKDFSYYSERLGRIKELEITWHEGNFGYGWDGRMRYVQYQARMRVRGMNGQARLEITLVKNPEGQWAVDELRVHPEG